MKIIPIESKETYDWLLNVHYAKRIPHIMRAFGLYDGDALIGVVTYGMPASPSLCVGVCGQEYSGKVLELNRLCLMNNDKNQASMLVSGSIKQLPKPTIVVSYADTAKGHIGYVYQACNFLFTGTTKERTDMGGKDGKHSRHSFGDSSIRVNRSAKHRYILFHGSKNDKKILRSKLKYKIQPYPKGKTNQYKITHKPSTQVIMNF